MNQQKHKNIIWVFGDQHRSQAISLHGDPNLRTPHIDRMGVEGVDFNRALMGYPLCCPCRGSLLTGRYPHHCVPGHEVPLPTEMPTIGHVFDQAGYDTAWFGKWHLDGYKEEGGRAAFHTVPRERRGGFNTWVGYENNNSPWDCWVHGHDAEGREIKHERLSGFETDALTDRLIEYVRERSDRPGSRKPFFAALSVQPPHDPYVGPARFQGDHAPGNLRLRPNVPPVQSVEERARRDLAGYYAMIENLDWNLGRVLEFLEEKDMARDTFVVFFSDHGDLLGSHGQFRKTAPWEESIRVPFAIWGGAMPHYEANSGACGVLVNHVDVAPTSLGLCGIAIPEWMQGRELSGCYLKARSPVEKPGSAYLQNIRLTGHADSVDQAWRGVVSDDGWKLVCFESVYWLMFDLNTDPFEQVNLAHNPGYAEKRTRLLKELEDWCAKTGDSFPLPSR